VLLGNVCIFEEKEMNGSTYLIGNGTTDESHRKIEVIFFPGGENSKCSDTIFVKHNLLGVKSINVIDTGSVTGLNALKKHLANERVTKINDLIVTHSDADHSSQVCSLIEEIEIGTIWMHLPWNYVKDKFAEEGITNPMKQNKLINKLKLQYKYVSAIKDSAEKRGINIKEPFNGDRIDSFLVISPSKEFLQQLLTESDKVDEVFKSVGEEYT
jgi:hypothetical protein